MVTSSASSLSICLNPPKADGSVGGSIVSATLFANVVTAGSDTISFELTADGGSNWESVSNSTSHNFVVTGADLRWRAVLVGTGGANTYFDSLVVEYDVQ